jgi:hypothetical protein
MSYQGSEAIIGRGTEFAVGPVAGTTVPTGLTGTTTSASTSVTAISSTAAVAVGMTVTGTGIPANTTVAAKGSGTITLSQAATATGSAIALTFGIAYTLVGEVDSDEPSGREWDTEEVTNFQSDVDKEHIKALRNPGIFTVTGNRVQDDAGQELLDSAFDDTKAYLFQLTFPLAEGQTTPEMWQFTALVLSVDPPQITPGKVIKFSTKLQVTGPRTVVDAA